MSKPLPRLRHHPPDAFRLFRRDVVDVKGEATAEMPPTAADYKLRGTLHQRTQQRRVTARPYFQIGILHNDEPPSGDFKGGPDGPPPSDHNCHTEPPTRQPCFLNRSLMPITAEQAAAVITASMTSATPAV